jgi:excisionase family DNA binding protein
MPEVLAGRRAYAGKLLLDVVEVAGVLGCGRTYVYELINRGELRPVKLGRLTRIPVASVEDFVRRKTGQPGDGGPW